MSQLQGDHLIENWAIFLIRYIKEKGLTQEEVSNISNLVYSEKNGEQWVFRPTTQTYTTL